MMMMDLGRPSHLDSLNTESDSSHQINKLNRPPHPPKATSQLPPVIPLDENVDKPASGIGRISKCMSIPIGIWQTLRTGGIPFTASTTLQRFHDIPVSQMECSTNSMPNLYPTGTLRNDSEQIDSLDVGTDTDIHISRAGTANWILPQGLLIRVIITLSYLSI